MNGIGKSEQYVKTDPIGKYLLIKQLALECPKHAIRVILQGRKLRCVHSSAYTDTYQR